ncbi:transposable element Tcb1 transposase [Elysia marginata]|uniref:Transposable element Tcb1 transposase n=1 Tax=Elysia marginata TaxID=1093978 RepID=A0AAV4EVK1_9GAST|nr:transposable element Tcb1 transposase [Elysia marginata]
MPRLSEVDLHRALGLLQAGLPISEVSLRMNVNRTTIFRLRQRLHETHTMSDRPRTWRPRCTTQRQDRDLVRNNMNNRFLSASAPSRHTRGRNNQRISANTVRRRLSTSGLRPRRPYIGPILTQRHRHQRTLWAEEHAAWYRIQWRGVVFSHESRFCIDHADGRVRLWRRSGERNQAHCVREHDRWGGASLMMWGAVLSLTMMGLGQFFHSRRAINAQTYVQDMLQAHVVPYTAMHRNIVFQQDNAKAHTARYT